MEWSTGGKPRQQINNISLRLTAKVLWAQRGDIAASASAAVRACSSLSLVPQASVALPPSHPAPLRAHLPVFLVCCPPCLVACFPLLLLLLSLLGFYGQMQWHVSHSVCNINSLTCHTHTHTLEVCDTCSLNGRRFVWNKQFFDHTSLPRVPMWWVYI